MSKNWHIQYCPDCGDIGLALDDRPEERDCAFCGTKMKYAVLKVRNRKPVVFIEVREVKK